MSQESTVCPAEPMDSEDMLFLLYTSGSTGKPKGIQHSQAGYLLYTNLTFKVSKFLTSVADKSGLVRLPVDKLTVH